LTTKSQKFTLSFEKQTANILVVANIGRYCLFLRPCKFLKSCKH